MCDHIWEDVPLHDYYYYDFCGMNNVWLKGGVTYRICKSFKVPDGVAITAMVPLHEAIADALYAECERTEHVYSERVDTFLRSFGRDTEVFKYGVGIGDFDPHVVATFKEVDGKPTWSAVLYPAVVGVPTYVTQYNHVPCAEFKMGYPDEMYERMSGSDYQLRYITWGNHMTAELAWHCEHGRVMYVAPGATPAECAEKLEKLVDASCYVHDEPDM